MSGQFIVGVDELIVFADSRYAIQAAREAPDARVETVYNDLPARWPELVGSLGARRVGVEVFYNLFDLLYLNGYDLRNVPLIHRKALLRAALDFRDPLHFTEHRERDGEAYYREACGKGLEGVIAKRGDGRYGEEWFKIRNPNYSQYEGRHELFERWARPESERRGQAKNWRIW